MLPTVIVTKAGATLEADRRLRRHGPCACAACLSQRGAFVRIFRPHGSGSPTRLVACICVACDERDFIDVRCDVLKNYDAGRLSLLELDPLASKEPKP